MLTADRIYDYLLSYIARHGYAPTVREIGRAVGIHSTSVVADHLDRLHGQGRIRRQVGVARGIQVVGQAARPGDTVVIETAEGHQHAGRVVAVVTTVR